MNIYFKSKNNFYKYKRKVDKNIVKRILRRLEKINAINRKFSHISYPPEYIQIDITNRCNLKCIHCPQSSAKMDNVKKGTMSFELYKKIIDEAVLFNIFSVFLVLSGEPLLNKDVFKMIEYANQIGLKTLISTNAVLLDKDISGRLIKSGLDEIMFSFDSADKTLYERLRNNRNYDKVLKNIREFIELKKSLYSKSPLVIIQNLRPYYHKLSPSHKPELEPEMIELFYNEQVYLFPKYIFNWGGNVNGDFYYNISGANMTYKPCKQIFERIVIGWDGKVYSCCYDLLGEQVVGDLTKNSILEVWNGEEFKSLRYNILNKKIEFYPLCKNCTDLWIK